ncbi:Uncharacterised protein [Mycobacteroides abscessus subsp. abscessus]|nr:Uncharacterised protein [Mycobacteroides abscessus subsp. abscessus]
MSQSSDVPSRRRTPATESVPRASTTASSTRSEIPKAAACSARSVDTVARTSTIARTSTPSCANANAASYAASQAVKTTALVPTSTPYRRR